MACVWFNNCWTECVCVKALAIHFIQLIFLFHLTNNLCPTKIGSHRICSWKEKHKFTFHFKVSFMHNLFFVSFCAVFVCRCVVVNFFFFSFDRIDFYIGTTAIVAITRQVDWIIIIIYWNILVRKCIKTSKKEQRERSALSRRNEEKKKKMQNVNCKTYPKESVFFFFLFNSFCSALSCYFTCYTAHVVQKQTNRYVSLQVANLTLQVGTAQARIKMQTKYYYWLREAD